MHLLFPSFLLSFFFFSFFLSFSPSRTNPQRAVMLCLACQGRSEAKSVFIFYFLSCPSCFVWFGKESEGSSYLPTPITHWTSKATVIRKVEYFRYHQCRKTPGGSQWTTPLNRTQGNSVWIVGWPCPCPLSTRQAIIWNLTMHFWRSLCTLYLLACQTQGTVGNSSLYFCDRMMSFER